MLQPVMLIEVDFALLLGTLQRRIPFELQPMLVVSMYDGARHVSLDLPIIRLKGEPREHPAGPEN